MFDIKSVPKIVIREASIGNVEIKKFGSIYQLFVDGIRWNFVNTASIGEVKEFYSSYDLAEGNVLLSGFGFGLLPQWIASKESVRSVTVVELNPEVVEIFKSNNILNPKIEVVISDIREYKDEEVYDWGIFDHYELERAPTKEELDLLSKNINFKNLWFWSLEYKLKSYTNWKSFKEDYGLKLPNLNNSKLQEYLGLFNYKANLLD
jgi:hypothetical protein